MRHKQAIKQNKAVVITHVHWLELQIELPVVVPQIDFHYITRCSRIPKRFRSSCNKQSNDVKSPPVVLSGQCLKVQSVYLKTDLPEHEIGQSNTFDLDLKRGQVDQESIVLR